MRYRYGLWVEFYRIVLENRKLIDIVVDCILSMLVAIPVLRCTGVVWLEILLGRKVCDGARSFSDESGARHFWSPSFYKVHGISGGRKSSIGCFVESWLDPANDEVDLRIATKHFFRYFYGFSIPFDSSIFIVDDVIYPVQFNSYWLRSLPFSSKSWLYGNMGSRPIAK